MLAFNPQLIDLLYMKLMANAGVMRKIRKIRHKHIALVNEIKVMETRTNKEYALVETEKVKVKGVEKQVCKGDFQ